MTVQRQSSGCGIKTKYGVNDPLDRIPIINDFMKSFDIQLPERAKSRENRETQKEKIWYLTVKDEK